MYGNGLGLRVEVLWLRGLRSWQLRNVLLCRAIARIGEVPQAEGFSKNQRRSFSNLAENNPCGLCRHPYPRIGARTPPIASQTEGDIAMFQPLNYYVTKSHCPWNRAPIPRRRGGTGGDIATFPAIQIEQTLCIALNLDLIFG